ncbi:MAG: MerR family transcriptional regulator [Pseudomonadota bacterium]|nr:MerR family transcriptional regulator [Pseudomonadota bacterium]
MSQMTIGQFAKAAGVGVETVRYYQRRDLLEVPFGEDSGRYGRKVRHYSESDLRRLRFILSAKKAGFTLSEIKELISLDATQDRARAHELAEKRLRAIDALMEELALARDGLRKLAASCATGAPGPCPILSTFEH